MKTHRLDLYPIPTDQRAVFINEPWLLDPTIEETEERRNPDVQADNSRVYIPLDINSHAILRRLDGIITTFETINTQNVSAFRSAIHRLILQIEIYDQMRGVRELVDPGQHSPSALQMLPEFIRRLEAVPKEADAGSFPEDVIEKLRADFFGESEA